MSTLATTVNGLKFTNPFVIGSGPPGTNVKVIKRAFKEGWGGVIAKTVSLDSSKVINVSPRYGKLTANDGKRRQTTANDGKRWQTMANDGKRWQTMANDGKRWQGSHRLGKHRAQQRHRPSLHWSHEVRLRHGEGSL